MPEPEKEITAPLIPELEKDIPAPCLLMVEGMDDKHFFAALVRHLGKPKRAVEIRKYASENPFRVALAALVNATGFDRVRSFAVIRDADRDVDDTFTSIRDALVKVDLPCPCRPGGFAATPDVRVGVYVLPGEGQNGCLEDLCLQTVAAHVVTPCVDAYLACLKQVCITKPVSAPRDPKESYFPKHESKAKALAFLAGMYDAPKAVGYAAQKGYWPLDSPALDPLREFLRQLWA